jgi:TolB-like protein
MAQQGSTVDPAKVAHSAIGEQLNRILASKTFRQADRLKRFISFIVEETIAGRGERLKEFVVGVEVFGKPESFDPRNDPIVRVQARRLRAQLSRYYREEAPNSEMLIELPKGGYAPVFKPLKSAPVRRVMTPALVSRNTAVVIPFADHSAAGDQGPFCDGLTQEIVHTLAHADGIRLVAWDEERPGASLVGIRTSAERLNAAVVVTGSVRTAGSQARIIMNLIDVSSGCYLWSGAIDRTFDDVFAVQEEVAREIADQL